jgi:hypothetical protein
MVLVDLGVNSHMKKLPLPPLVVVTGLLIFITSQAWSQPYGAPMTLNGVADCGMWIEARATNRAMPLEHSLQGFINGVSLGSGFDVWTANGVRTSKEQAFFFIDNYCQKNPLSTIWEGGMVLANEKTNNAIRNQLRRNSK